MISSYTRGAFESALAGDYSLLRAVPKADLHAHGLLSAGLESVRRIIPSVQNPPDSFSTFKEFADYIDVNYFPTNDISAYEFKLYEAALLTMINEGVVYAEMSFDLLSPASAHVSWEEYSRQLRELKEKYSEQITLCPELGIHRATPQHFWKSEVPKALATGIFGSTDLYGDYNTGLLKDFTDFFNMAREAGLKIKYHSGEFADADRLEQDISEYGADAVQHGITSAKSPSLLRKIAQKEIMCNVCVTSNLKLAGIRNVKEHPIRAMFDAGIKLSLGTDDLSVFGSTLSEEYLKLYKDNIFSVAELELIRTNGLAELEKYQRKSEAKSGRHQA